jgi:hypothetical protein
VTVTCLVARLPNSAKEPNLNPRLMKTLEFSRSNFVHNAVDQSGADVSMAADRRKNLAIDLSKFLNLREFQPYCPNEKDDFFWTIDGGNDWKLKFLEDQPNRVQIWYRYHAMGRNPHEEALIPWLVVRLGAKLVCKDGTTVGAEDWPKLMAELCPPLIPAT